MSRVNICIYVLKHKHALIVDSSVALGRFLRRLVRTMLVAPRTTSTKGIFSE